MSWVLHEHVDCFVVLVVSQAEDEEGEGDVFEDGHIDCKGGGVICQHHVDCIFVAFQDQ